MNSEMSPSENASEEVAPSGGLAFGDILFILFRHKYLILGSLLLGLFAAMAARFWKPPIFESTAQIYLPFVMEIPTVNPNDPETGITRIGNPQMQMLTEVNLLQTFDTAQMVVDAIGAEKILAPYGGGSNRLGAAGIIASGISVSPPQSTMLTVTFSHRDAELVQPVMQALMDVYMQRHKTMRVGNIDEFVSKRDEAATKLSGIEQEIRKLKMDEGVTDLKERREAVDQELNELQSRIIQSKAELSRRRAELGELNQTMTNLQVNVIPSEAITTYSSVLAQIDEIRRRQRTLMLDDLTTNHPSVIKLEVKMQEQIRQKASLETAYPTLTNYIGSLSRNDGTNDMARLDLEMGLTSARRLERTITADESSMAILTKESFRLMGLERDLTELERQRDAGKKEYEYYANAVDRVKMDEVGPGKAVNMKLMQVPTPPAMNKKKQRKLMVMGFGVCVGFGLGLAFLIDLVLDRSIRRPSQISRLLHLPVVATIPDAHWSVVGFLPWRRANMNMKITKADKKMKNDAGTNAIAPWSPDHHLQAYIEGLRERVITYFEVKNPIPNTKLVAVTACNKGAGVSTLANGLAASLSRTGNGSVLLVDMNTAEGVTHSFYKGKPGYGPSEPIVDDVNVQTDKGDLAVTKISPSASQGDRLSGMLPPDINGHLPRLKTDTYDYVVFDMTTIAPASVTPRMSGRMDLVLFVIESEKTKDHIARSAYALLCESRANVVAVLNKYHNPVPEWLAHD